MIRILILLITINTEVVFSASDLFSSMSDMEQLYHHEVSIGEQMEAHLKVRIVFIFWGHSITTWTRFCLSFTPSPLSWTDMDIYVPPKNVQMDFHAPPPPISDYDIFAETKLYSPKMEVSTLTLLIC